ncbi:MAG: methionine--tRNA ligase [Candidatus Yonathbacteria bacterium]|nr:methionine--tRNA ligase [Candidatus Yonathbacteria bacterium]
MKNTFYITTTLPYVNADPHLGHALEFVHADIIARYKRLLGQEVFFNIGTDEHGQKILEKATMEGKRAQEYADYYALRFRQFADLLAVSYTNFIRTTDSHHVAAATEFWKRCDANGDIYKKLYTVKYCVGCELPKSDSELLGGKCPIHPTTEIELREEENYFFRFSKYQDALLKLYNENSDFILPPTRRTEITKFVERGLQDFSISRLKEKMPWGIGVPGDEEHVMYVWFDALVNYVSAIGWPDDREKFEKWWPVVQMAGKDNLRQQVAMWQAMLFSAGITPSKQIIIHGFITSGGQKMSKSVGNVFNPVDIVKEYGVDALRYYLARKITPFEDGDFTIEHFKEVYNADLANGLGNLTSRILKMSALYLDGSVAVENRALTDPEMSEYRQYLDGYEISKAADLVWKHIGELDKHIQETEPFKLIKEDKEKAIEIVRELVKKLHQVSVQLLPFLPETAAIIQESIAANKIIKPLFMRK